MTHHKIKILPEYFKEVLSGHKTFEVRLNDRNYQSGDTVTLREWNGEYTRCEATFKIGYVYAIDAQRVVFSLLSTKFQSHEPAKVKSGSEDTNS